MAEHPRLSTPDTMSEGTAKDLRFSHLLGLGRRTRRKIPLTQCYARGKSGLQSGGTAKCDPK